MIYLDNDSDYTVVGKDCRWLLIEILEDTESILVWWVEDRDSEFLEHGKAVLPMEFLSLK